MSGLSFFPTEIKMPSLFQSCSISLYLLTYLSQFLPKSSATPTEFYISSPEGKKYALRSSNVFFNNNLTSLLNNEPPCGATDINIDVRTQIGSIRCDMWEGIPMSIEFDAMTGFTREGFEFRDCFYNFAKNICENTRKLPAHPGARADTPLPIPSTACPPCATKPIAQDSFISTNLFILIAVLTAFIIFTIMVYRLWRNRVIRNNRINQINRAVLLPPEANPVQERYKIVELRLEEIKQLLKDSKLISPEFQNELTQFEKQLGTFIEKYNCPIGHELMNKPISLKSGITFERIQIINTLRTGRTTCPVTNLPIESIANLPSINVLIKDTIDTGLKGLEDKIKLLHQRMITLHPGANSQQSSKSERQADESQQRTNRPRMKSQ